MFDIDQCFEQGKRLRSFRLPVTVRYSSTCAYKSLCVYLLGLHFGFCRGNVGLGRDSFRS
jgi:hypothetical protein